MGASEFDTKGGSFVRASVEVTAKKSFSIGIGANGSAVDAVDLEANCKGLVLRCANCAGIPADTTLSVYVGDAAADDLCAVHKVDGTGLLTFAMPTSGTWRALVSHAFGGRRVRLVLSKVTTAVTAFEVMGIDLGE